jgi:hypothetical protein
MMMNEIKKKEKWQVVLLLLFIINKTTTKIKKIKTNERTKDIM